MRTHARHRTVTRLVAAGAIAALTLGLAACSSDSSSDDAANSAAGDSSSTTPTGSDGAADTSQNADGSGSAAADDTASNPADSSAPAGDVTLTIYTGQHEDLVKDITDHFTADTGVKVVLRAGDDADLANQIIEEGSSSPADIFLTEEPGPIGLVDSKGLLAPVDKAALDEVDSRLVPSTGNWLPYAARTRVIYYNPKLISEADLPHSILDLTDPKWKGTFAYAPSGAFTSTVSYLISDIGKDKTLAWLKGIKANGINEQKNGKVRDSVEAGQHAFGLSNHYYWYILARDKGGADKLTSKVYYFNHVDPGGLLLASGAGILKSSKHQAEAQKFLAWLGSADGGQKLIAGDNASQYPVAPGVVSDAGMPPLADLKFPKVDPTVFADTTEAKDLIIAAGIV